MPPTLTTMRVGEVMRATARVLDNLGQPTEIENPNFSDFAGDVVDLVPVENPDAYPYQVLVSGEAPGSDTLTFNGRDFVDNGVTVEVPVRVLDASRLLLRASAPVACRLVQVKGRLVVHMDVSPEVDPHFTLTVVPVDERYGQARSGGGEPTYALSDGPDLSSQHGRVVFNGGPTSSDDPVVTVNSYQRGEDTISATAVTAATGQTITGSLNVVIVTASDATITAEPEV